jgi:hypothetical protein
MMSKKKEKTECYQVDVVEELVGNELGRPKPGLSEHFCNLKKKKKKR